MKVNKNQIFTIIYYVVIVLYSIIGFVINAYYEYTILQIFLFVAFPTIILIERIQSRLNRLTYFIVLALCQLIVIMPFSIEFFIPIIDLSSFLDLERVIFSPIMVYPAMLFILFIEWKNKITYS
tara:strand:- start:1672 stop:2043 length:372 start_codon:yes stop_codon:yes gene_type:complete